jgi:spermidine synthase
MLAPVNNAMKKFLPLLAFLLIGAYTIVVQVIFIREFMVVFFGNELCLGIILACWLIGIAIGAATGGRISKKAGVSYATFSFYLIIISLLPLIQISCIRLIRALLNVPPGEYINLLSLILSTFILIGPFSFIIGVIFPAGCKLLGLHEDNKAQSIGQIYITEALGSLSGGMILTFFLIDSLNPYAIISLASLLILSISFLFTAAGKRRKDRITTSFSLLFLLLNLYLLISGNSANLDNLLVRMRWYSYQNHLEMSLSLNSRYQNIVLALGNEQYSLFGNGQYIGSFPDPYQSSDFAHSILTQHPEPRSILLIGGGTTGIIHEILKYPVQRIHYVELDPKLVEATYPFLSNQDKTALDDERVEIFYTDGRHFVKITNDTYDMVIVNVPDPSTANLNRFYTLEFFKEVQDKLNAGGVLVTAISSSVNYLGAEVGMYTSSLYHTLKILFPFIVVTPGTENYFFATSKPGVISSESEVLAQRFAKRNIHSDYFSPFQFASLWPEERVKSLKRALKKKRTNQINTDTFPVTYFYNLVLWDIISGERGKETFFQAIGVNLRWAVIPLVLLFFLRIAYVLIRKDRLGDHLKFNGLLAITTTGFAGMALEIILLFAYQNIYGFLYYKVGLIVAVFMLGLSLGGWLMTRLIAGREQNWIKLLAILEFTLVLYCLSLPFIISTFSTQATSLNLILEYLYMLLVVGAGWLTGLQFPLVSKILITQDDIGRVAGWVDSSDHLGACCGAFLTGTILVPLLGTLQSCFLTAILNCMSGVLLLTYLVQKGKQPH